jgi:hypothetical protein
MEFHTEREEALYTTLKQVLQNHVSNHRLGYPETLSAWVSVLGYVLMCMSDDWDKAPGLVESTVAELKQRTPRARIACTPDTPDLPDYVTRAAMTELGHDRGTALATFLAASGIRHNIGGRHLACLSLPRRGCPGDASMTARTRRAEADAEIETLRDELPVVMRLWDEEAR